MSSMILLKWKNQIVILHEESSPVLWKWYIQVTKYDDIEVTEHKCDIRHMWAIMFCFMYNIHITKYKMITKESKSDHLLRRDFWEGVTRKGLDLVC